MLKFAKFACLTVVSGIVVGFGVVGWLYAHKPTTMALAQNASKASSNLGTIGVSSSPDTLSVTNSGNQGSVLGDSSNETSETPPSPTPTTNGDSLPGPSGFSVYDQYKNNASALFQDVVVGTGKPVERGSLVTVQYRGYLINGTEFDDSYSGGKPFTFTEGAGTVITGWEEGLFGMKAGGQRRLIIPPSQGYGSVAHGPIPPDSVLIFDVVLISVN
jgi:hypothetical protein